MKWEQQGDGSYLCHRDGRTFFTRWRAYGLPRRGGHWQYGEIIGGGVRVIWGETPLLISARHDVSRRAAEQ